MAIAKNIPKNNINCISKSNFILVRAIISVVPAIENIVRIANNINNDPNNVYRNKGGGLLRKEQLSFH